MPAQATVTLQSTASAPAPEPALPPAVVALRRHLLHEFRGPQPRSAYSVRCRWPLVRSHVLAAVRVLTAEGLLERISAEDGAAGYRTTAAGQALLAASRLRAVR
jgi:hypothetical protein